MSLLGFQSALAHFVRASAQASTTEASRDAQDGFDLDAMEREELARLKQSRGMQVTRRIRRSWCEGRAANAARLTLSALPLEERQRIVREWVDSGGGAGAFSTGEAEAFLAFIAARQADPSHALTLARFEWAVLRAARAMPTFQPPDPAILSEPQTHICVGSFAALVDFFAEPTRLLAAVENGEPLPSLAVERHRMLIAPGLPGLCRIARSNEAALWDRLAMPVTMAKLAADGCRRATIAAFVAVGAAAPWTAPHSCAPEEAGRAGDVAGFRAGAARA
jgi:hypothetical protein